MPAHGGHIDTCEPCANITSGRVAAGPRELSSVCTPPPLSCFIPSFTLTSGTGVGGPPSARAFSIQCGLLYEGVLVGEEIQLKRLDPESNEAPKQLTCQ